MAVIRLIIFVTVVVGLILFLVQNLSPSLPLVFLGMRTQPLPLALWILLCLAAGIFTFLIITSLLKFATSLNLQAEQQPIPKSIPTSSRVRKNTASPSNPPPPVTDTDDESDDWDTNRDQDDWDSFENLQPASKSSESQQSSQGTRTSSVYSYSSQEPKNTAVGKTESIYDADYRVIIPPYQESSKNQAIDDDWDFFEDEDFEDDDENKPQKR